VPSNAASLPDDIESLRRLIAAQCEERDAERAARKAAESALFSRDLLIEKLQVQLPKQPHRRTHAMDLEPNGGAEGGIKNHGLETTLPWEATQTRNSDHQAHFKACN
jgi:hypothetical protein